MSCVSVCLGDEYILMSVLKRCCVSNMRDRNEVKRTGSGKGQEHRTRQGAGWWLKFQNGEEESACHRTLKV